MVESNNILESKKAIIMNFELKSLSQRSVSESKLDALVVVLTADFRSDQSVLGQLIQKVLDSKELSDKGASLNFWHPAGLKIKHLLLVQAEQAQPEQLKTAMQSAVSWAKKLKVSDVHVVMPKVGAQGWSAALQSASDATYLYQATKPSAESIKLKRLILCVSAIKEAQAHFDRAYARVLGTQLAREWGNRPANHATPTLLGKAAQELAKFPNIRCEVMGPKEVERLKMGSFMSVAQGSVEPLRFIVLQYKSRAVKSDAAPVVLVGKGITFDTGGISLKPGAGMDEMKFDMCGAASVLGTFRALAQLQPAINVIGLIPTCENMPSGNAIKPGDVVTSMSGQTIEILNTDAEGRLILCDALTYAKRFKAKAVIDIATLTGACVIALGHVRTGMFSSDDALAYQLLKAGEDWQDLCWRMPLDEEYAEGLKSNFADVANVADRSGGAITAAKFLHRFSKDFPWAHLDIAGTAWKSGASKGATGRPVGLLLGYLLSQAKGGSGKNKK
jgi:leucyl aminopeptidase